VRRRTGAFTGLFAALFLAVGVIALVGDVNVIVKVLGVIALVGGVILGLVAWGLLNSIRVDRYAAELDAEIAAAIAEHDATCNCGHNHATEPAKTCAGDGTGANCTKTCATCTHSAVKS
jgi:hypothetical protein